MNTENMERLIKNLGCSYDALIANSVIDTVPLQSLYEDDETLEALPEPGLELVFWPETQRFEVIHINLSSEDATELPSYTGALPDPFSKITDQRAARHLLGVPIYSKSPLELQGTNLGGWDTYQLDTSIHPAVVVDLQYSNQLKLSVLQFSLIDRNV